MASKAAQGSGHVGWGGLAGIAELEEALAKFNYLIIISHKLSVIKVNFSDNLSLKRNLL